MGVLFGTDGIRGIVGENLTVELAFRVGQAVTEVLAEQTGKQPNILIGKDTRISSDMLEAALMAGICSVGGNVLPLGTTPTPAVAYLTILEKADAGIVISASHNPFEHNGIKIFNGQGYKLSDQMEAEVESRILSGKEFAHKTGGEIGRRFHGMKILKQAYINHLAGSIQHDLSGLRILVDCSNGAASETAMDLFGRFNAEVDFIHCEPDGININEKCGSTHMDILKECVVADGYDLGVAFDGDADRCLLVDELGREVDGDAIMAVCAADMKKKGTLTGDAVVATVMSNLGLHEFCRENGLQLYCTSVGDRNVLEKMLEIGGKLGGEQSGHMIFTDFATTGDGQLTALQFLQILACSGMKASELVGSCPKYPQVLVNVRLANTPGLKEQVMGSEELKAAVAAEENALAGEGRILVRASGTEPLIRVMVEAKTTEKASEVAEKLATLVKNL